MSLGSVTLDIVVAEAFNESMAKSKDDYGERLGAWVDEASSN